jgi:hypothetical protein
MPKPQKRAKLIGPSAKPKVRGSGWAYQPGTLELGPTEFISLGSALWLAWLQQELAFRVEQVYYLANKSGLNPYFLSYTVRPERRQRGQVYWYPYKKYHNQRLYGSYLGKIEAVTLAHLDQVALQFLAQIDPAFYHQVCQIGLYSFPNRPPPHSRQQNQGFEKEPTAHPFLAKVPQPAITLPSELLVSVVKNT